MKFIFGRIKAKVQKRKVEKKKGMINMKCENCGKNEVAFVYQSNVNGHVTEKHLCAGCAAKLGYTQRFAAQSQRIDDLFNSSFFGGSLLNSFRTGALSPMAGLFDDFFADMPALGAPAGQEPKSDALVEPEEQSRFGQQREKNALQRELQEAVECENYERAAELRDRIRALEK